ncbi:MAG: metalloregulator ArsR/SmtB family transcription factor [Acidobacteria bacterium]|nr:metalloregulator ArsR/SmtB family transcription factor [Acidobacteriota bacterium]
MDVKEASALMRLLGDEARLRLLRLLAREALNVTELTAVMGLAQSGVSRHLGLLKEAKLVTEERSGNFTWYRLNSDVQADAGAYTTVWPWLSATFDAATAATRADDARLEEVRRLRRENFDQHGGGDERSQLVPGRSWVAWSRALGLLLPAVDVADLGCGSGYLTIEAAHWARRVYAVDRSADVLARAKQMALRRKVKNITWKRGELEKVPLADESIDIAIASQALHHAQEPETALSEALRILRPGGRLLVLDLRQHDEAWVQDTLGDQWLGFSASQLEALITAAGFEKVTVRSGTKKAGDPFVVLIAAGTRPS